MFSFYSFDAILHSRRLFCKFNTRNVSVKYHMRRSLIYIYIYSRMNVCVHTYPRCTIPNWQTPWDYRIPQRTIKDFVRHRCRLGCYKHEEKCPRRPFRTSRGDMVLALCCTVLRVIFKRFFLLFSFANCWWMSGMCFRTATLPYSNTNTAIIGRIAASRTCGEYFIARSLRGRNPCITFTPLKRNNREETLSITVRS